MYIITFAVLVILAMFSINFVYEVNTKEYKLSKDLLNSFLFLVLMLLFLVIFTAILGASNIWLFSHIVMVSVILSNLSVYFITNSYKKA